MSGDDEPLYTEAELDAELQRVRDHRKVLDVVCEKTGRRWPMLTWTYATGIVNINTTFEHKWGNDFITTSVKTVHARSIRDGSSSEMTCYNLVLALINTGLTNAALGSFDLGNQRVVLSMLRELVDAHLLSDKEEREQAIAESQASKLARHLQWGDEI